MRSNTQENINHVCIVKSIQSTKNYFKLQIKNIKFRSQTSTSRNLSKVICAELFCFEWLGKYTALLIFELPRRYSFETNARHCEWRLDWFACADLVSQFPPKFLHHLWSVWNEKVIPCSKCVAPPWFLLIDIYLTRPVSGSTTRLIWLCRWSNSAFVSGHFARFMRSTRE